MSADPTVFMFHTECGATQLARAIQGAVCGTAQAPFYHKRPLRKTCDEVKHVRDKFLQMRQDLLILLLPIEICVVKLVQNITIYLLVAIHQH